MSAVSMVPVALLAGLERTVNAVVALDPETVRRLKGLAGRVIGIALQGTGVTVYAEPTAEGRLRLMGHFDGEADAVLRGTPLSLLRVAAGESTGLFAGDVVIEGDLELGQRFRRVLDALDVDWEEHLSRLTGDIVAHQVGNAVRGLREWGRRSADILARDGGEYLQEELQLLPDRGEAEQFSAAVDTLRGDADRLEARIRRLES